MSDQHVLVTGAAGRAAALLVPRVARPGRRLRLLDLREPDTANLSGDEEVVRASILDLDAMVEACTGVDAIVHLAGQADESTIDTVVERNVRGVYCVLEAARRAGVSRIVIASSHHAAGFHRHDSRIEHGLPADVTGRPDTLYGWSKVAAEAMGRLYADRFGLDVICLRIGGWREIPHALRDLALWLSPGDGARLVEAALTVRSPGFRTVWGVSRNSRGWLSHDEGLRIGYEAQDDAEWYARQLIAEHGDPDFDTDPDLSRLGGGFCDLPLGVPIADDGADQRPVAP